MYLLTIRFKIIRLRLDQSIGFEQFSGGTEIVSLHIINMLLFVMETYCLS